jgi:hypothetical protein
VPTALHAYEALLEEQNLKWVEGDERGGEVVRVSRSREITAASNFSETIKRYRLGVRGQKQEATSG